jgi:hypothetical protein
MNRRGMTSSRWLLVLVGIAVALAITGAVSFFGYAKRAAPDAHRFAVAPFELYVSGLDRWRLEIAGGLSTRLHQLPGWSAVPQALIAERWQGKERPEIAAVEVARRTAAGLAVYGRVDSLGSDSVRVNVILIDVPTTVVTSAFKLDVPRSASPEAVADGVTARIRDIMAGRQAAGGRSPSPER